MASRATLELLVTLKDQATSGLSAIGGTLRGLSTAGLAVAAGGVAAVTAGLGAAGLSGLQFNNSMEIVTAQLNAFTKDGRKSAEILAMIKDRASKTPFEFEQMAQATTALLPASKASGVALEDLIAKAEILAASNPAEGLEGAAFALKEAVSGDFTSIIERFNLPRQRLNQLKDEGVPALEAVQIAMQELGLDTDLVTNLANTAQGRWSTFKDTMTGISAVAMKPVFDALSNGMAQVNDWLTRNEPLVTAFAEGIAVRLAGAINWLIVNVPIMVGSLVAFAESVQRTNDAFHGMIDAVRDAGLMSSEFGEALGALATSIGLPGEKIQDFTFQLQGLVEYVRGGGLIQSFNEATPGILASIERWRAVLTGWITEAVPQAQTQITGYVQQIIGQVQAQLPGWIDALKGWGRAAVEWVIETVPPLLSELVLLRNRLIGWALEQVPGIIDAIRPWSIALLQWIVDAAPGVIREIGRLTGDLLDRIGAALPGIVESLAAWGAELVAWIIKAAPGLFQELLVLSSELLTWIGERVPGIAAQLGEWTIAFLKWVGPMAGELIVALGHMFGDLLAWIVDGAPGLNETLNAWTEAFVTWAVEKLAPALIEALAAVGSRVWGELTSLWTNAFAEGSRGDQLLQDLGIRGGPVPGMASGGMVARGGVFDVGERGRERVVLPGGAAVIPNHMLGGGGGGQVNVYVTVQGNVTTENDLIRAIRDGIVQLGINNVSAFGEFA